MERLSVIGGTPLNPQYLKITRFIYTINSVTNSVVAKVRPLCYTGSFTNATIHVKAGRSLAENVIPDDTQNYSTLSKTRELTTSKMGHLKQMYRKFIPPDCCLPFVTVQC